MSAHRGLVVVGADSLVGEAMLQRLAHRRLPVGTVYAVSVADADGDVEFGDDELPLQTLAGFDFSQVTLALFAVDAATAAIWAPRAVDAGCIVIDRSPQFRNDPDVPLVIPEINAEALAGYRERGIVAGPDCGVVQMLLALKPLHDAAGLLRVDVASYQSVSGSGRAGIEALSRQTARALNGLGTDEFDVYPRPIAFNVIPQIGELDADGETREERGLRTESWRVLGDDRIAFNATAVRVPVFHGHAQALHVETRTPLSAVQARELLRQVPGLTVVDAGDGAYPTPLVEAGGGDSVYIGRIREDRSRTAGLNLWVVADNLRRGAAGNSIGIAEILLRDGA